MHMADALLSPAVGGLMWLAAGSALLPAARRLADQPDDARVPLMGLLGAFVFAAQMINFSIPGTGASGHLGGGLLLAILLGPQAALVVIASVLTVQALFFADGGLLALGANLFNLGVLPCLLAYPLVYRPLAGATPTPRRAAWAAVAAAVVGLQLGALGVVLETVLSGITSLPTLTFLLLMLPIHAAIGIVEGLATAALLLFLQRSRPELRAGPARSPQRGTRRPLLLGLALAALLTGSLLPGFASRQPDGLEWSVSRASDGSSTAARAPALHDRLARWQQQLAWLPGYGRAAAASRAGEAAAPWPDIEGRTAWAGVVGGGVTLALVMALGLALRRRRGAA